MPGSPCSRVCDLQAMEGFLGAKPGAAWGPNPQRPGEARCPSWPGLPRDHRSGSPDLLLLPGVPEIMGEGVCFLR